MTAIVRMDVPGTILTIQLVTVDADAHKEMSGINLTRKHLDGKYDSVDENGFGVRKAWEIKDHPFAYRGIIMANMYKEHPDRYLYPLTYKECTKQLIISTDRNVGIGNTCPI